MSLPLKALTCLMLSAKQNEERNFESSLIEKWSSGKWTKIDYIESERGLSCKATVLVNAT